ncbi:hypothetical protein Tco_1087751 [Tanacetum coccineum]
MLMAPGILSGIGFGNRVLIGARVLKSNLNDSKGDGRYGFVQKAKSSMGELKVNENSRSFSWNHNKKRSNLAIRGLCLLMEALPFIRLLKAVLDEEVFKGIQVTGCLGRFIVSFYFMRMSPFLWAYYGSDNNLTEHVGRMKKFPGDAWGDKWLASKKNGVLGVFGGGFASCLLVGGEIDTSLAFRSTECGRCGSFSNSRLPRFQLKVFWEGVFYVVVGLFGIS